MQEAYIVAGFRTAITKSKKGGFRFMRSDELAIEVIKGLMKTLPMLDHKLVDDVIVGNAVPEAEQGLQFGRMISATSPETMLGYYYWSTPIVNLMQKSRLFTKIVWVVARPWAYHMAYEMGTLEKDNLLGKILMKVGGFVSKTIGKSISAKNPRKSNQFANF